MIIEKTTIELKAGEEKVPLLFNTSFYRLFSMRLGLEKEEMIEKLAAGKLLTENNYPLLLLCAHETWCKFNAETSTMTEADAELLIDYIGGFNTETTLTVLKKFGARLRYMDDQEFERHFEVELEKVGKESEVQEKKSKRSPEKK